MKHLPNLTPFQALSINLVPTLIGEEPLVVLLKSDTKDLDIWKYLIEQDDHLCVALTDDEGNITKYSEHLMGDKLLVSDNVGLQLLARMLSVEEHTRKIATYSGTYLYTPGKDPEEVIALLHGLKVNGAENVEISCEKQDDYCEELVEFHNKDGVVEVQETPVPVFFLTYFEIDD